MSTVRYTANNSGGYDWITSHQWQLLVEAGWIAHFRHRGRYWGATREGLTLSEAVAEFEEVTGLDTSAIGCTCCGRPHHFNEYEGSADHA